MTTKKCFGIGMWCLASVFFATASEAASPASVKPEVSAKPELPALLITVRNSMENPIFSLVMKGGAHLVAVSDKGKAYEIITNNAVNPYAEFEVLDYAEPIENSPAWMPLGGGVGIDSLRIRSELRQRTSEDERDYKLWLLFTPQYRSVIETAMSDYMKARGIDPYRLQRAGKRLRLHATLGPDPDTLRVDGHSIE